MTFLTDLKARFTREHVTLALDDIQALILRARPEPYVGVHAMLHIDDAAGGRDLLLRMAAHLPSAAGWTDDRDAWMGMALSFQGLKALGLPEASLASFPLPFQQGMAQRAEQLRDVGGNAPEHWDPAFQPGSCHVALTIYARDEAALAVALEQAMGELERSHGVSLVGKHSFGADADAKNPFGFRDSISQPAIAGSGVAPLPGQERSIAAGEFILGEDSEPASRWRCPSRRSWAATARSW
jgi:deferrochelatase/peroxidase EfeB